MTKAYELLDSPEKWCQGPYAEDASGEAVDERSPDACSWCLVGAISRCYMPDGDDDLRDYLRACNAIRKAVGVECGRWNDAPERTFQEVRDVLLKLDI